MLASILAAVTASAALLMAQPTLQHHTVVKHHHVVAKHATHKATPKATKAPAKAKKVKHSHLQKMGRYGSFRSSSFGGYRSSSFGGYRSTYRSPSTYRRVYRPTTYNYNRSYNRYSRPYNNRYYHRSTYYRNTAIVHHYYHAPYYYHPSMMGGGGSGLGDMLVTMMVMNAMTHQMQPQYVYIQPGQQVPSYAQPVQGNQLPQGAAAQCQDQNGNIVSCDPNAGIPPTSPNGTPIATPQPTPTPQVVVQKQGASGFTKFLAFIGGLVILGILAVVIIAAINKNKVAA